MKETRPFKDKPWVVVHEVGFWASLLGVEPRMTIETSHPEWIERVLKPMIEKCKNFTP